MTRVKGWAVLLQPTVPKEFLELFSVYLSETRGVQYLLTSAVHPGSPFVGLTLVRQDERDWEVQIPYVYILAIVEASDPKHPLGFLPDAN